MSNLLPGLKSLEAKENVASASIISLFPDYIIDLFKESGDLFGYKNWELATTPKSEEYFKKVIDKILEVIKKLQLPLPGFQWRDLNYEDIKNNENLRMTLKQFLEDINDPKQIEGHYDYDEIRRKIISEVQDLLKSLESDIRSPHNRLRGQSAKTTQEIANWRLHLDRLTQFVIEEAFPEDPSRWLDIFLKPKPDSNEINSDSIEMIAAKTKEALKKKLIARNPDMFNQDNIDEVVDTILDPSNLYSAIKNLNDKRFINQEIARMKDHLTSLNQNELISEDDLVTRIAAVVYAMGDNYEHRRTYFYQLAEGALPFEIINRIIDLLHDEVAMRAIIKRVERETSTSEAA